MPPRDSVAVTKRFIDAPPQLVWALVADTNRMDRVLGLSPGKYEFVEPEAGQPGVRNRVATAKQSGLVVRWIEPPYEWIEGHFVRGERRFILGPVAVGGMEVRLTPKGTGTVVEARSWIRPKGLFGRLVAAYTTAQFRRKLPEYVNAIAQVFAGGKVPTAYGWSPEPPALLARSMLAGSSSTIAVGTRSPCNESELSHRARRFAEAPVAREVRDKIVEHLGTRGDDEVSQMRPFELARDWGLDRREVLRGFLHAARAGLVDLRWQLNCPTCRVASEVASSLEQVKNTAHCDACNITFDLDFAEHVEATFAVSPAIRRVESVLYCASSPWFLPHVFAQLTLEPGARRETEAVIPPGEFLVRTLRGKARGRGEVGARAPASATVRVTDDAITIRGEGEVEPGQPTRVAVLNETSEPAVLLAERAGWSADIVRGSVIATLPDFVDLFATEAPASGVEITVGSLTLLFSDLTGSTAMYERIGDARAFAIVEEHFREMSAVVARYNGALIKTMGDAVMASFPTPYEAFRAAVEMVRRCAQTHGALGLSVKLGLHEGPCLAVRANDRLDFFGTTVNVAARLQAQAEGGQIVVLAPLLDHPDVARAVRDEGLPVSYREAHLKGIRETQKLAVLDVSEADGTGAAAAAG